VIFRLNDVPYASVLTDINQMKFFSESDPVCLVCSGCVQFEQGWQHLESTKWREDWDID